MKKSLFLAAAFAAQGVVGQAAMASPLSFQVTCEQPDSEEALTMQVDIASGELKWEYFVSSQLTKSGAFKPAPNHEKNLKVEYVKGFVNTLVIDAVSTEYWRYTAKSALKMTLVGNTVDGTYYLEALTISHQHNDEAPTSMALSTLQGAACTVN